VIATASGIQIATLSVAALAVVTSFAGPYLVARFSVRSEYKVWQRDLRVRIYSNLATAADEYVKLLNQTPRPDRDQRITKLRALNSSMVDVDTYGSLSVRHEALRLFKECAMIVFAENPDQKAMTEAISDYRVAVRHSLKISDD
jgi:class 3 adenylate cyclase